MPVQRLNKCCNNVELRLGLNSVSKSTMAVIDSLNISANSCVPVKYFRTDTNPALKYPMMRQMFHDIKINSEYTMWFDDDSFIKTADAASWLNTVYKEAKQVDMLGSLYRINLRGDQSKWIEAQPWFTGKPVSSRQRILFCTGGWWVIRSSIVHRFDWPSKDILHRGGDVMLGELCRQQGLCIKHFNTQIAINADVYGNESKSSRRGYDCQPIGACL